MIGNSHKLKHSTVWTSRNTIFTGINHDLAQAAQKRLESPSVEMLKSSGHSSAQVMLYWTRWDPDVPSILSHSVKNLWKWSSWRGGGCWGEGRGQRKQVKQSDYPVLWHFCGCIGALCSVLDSPVQENFLNIGEILADFYKRSMCTFDVLYLVGFCGATGIFNNLFLKCEQCT